MQNIRRVLLLPCSRWSPKIFGWIFYCVESNRFVVVALSQLIASNINGAIGVKFVSLRQLGVHQFWHVQFIISWMYDTCCGIRRRRENHDLCQINQLSRVVRDIVVDRHPGWNIHETSSVLGTSAFSGIAVGLNSHEPKVLTIYKYLRLRNVVTDISRKTIIKLHLSLEAT